MSKSEKIHEKLPSPIRGEPTATDRSAYAESGDMPGGARAWVVTGMLLLFMMINFGDKAVVGLAAAAISEELGLSASQYGMIASGFFLLFSVSALGVGFLADRYPTKHLLLAMCLVWALTLLPLLGAASFALLLASRIVLGAAEGPAIPVASHAVQKWFGDKERSVPTAVINLGSSLGVIVAAPSLTWVIVNHGWRAAFATLAVIGFAWAAVWLVVGREGPVGTTVPGADLPSIRPLDHLRVPYPRLIGTGTWLGSALATFAAYWSLALLVAWVPPYLATALGYSPTAVGNLVTLPWITGAVALILQGLVTRWLMGRGVSSRWSRGVLGGCAVAVSGVLLLAFINGPDGWPKIVFMTLGFGISGVIFSVAATVCGEITPTRQRGGVLGGYVAIYALAGVVAPYVMGRLVDAAETPAAGFDRAFTISAVLLIACGLAAAVLIRPERDAARIAAATA